MGLLRGLTPDLNKLVNDTLGDELTYTAEGEDPRTFHAWIDFGSEHFNSPGSAATKRNTITVEIRRTGDLADGIEPKTNVDRIVIATRPGLKFTPADIRDGADGDTWVLPLKQVKDA
jgi:hypothetical protein